MSLAPDGAHPPLLRVRRLGGADPTLPLPFYATEGAAGADLCADLGGGQVTLAPLQRRLIPTGICLEIPPGYEVQLRPRSGAALRDGLGMVNAPGTIDSDYRGEIGVIAINLSADRLTIRHGDRIAQMVVAPVVQAIFAEVERLGESARGAGGFGSTGRGTADGAAREGAGSRDVDGGGMAPSIAADCEIEHGANLRGHPDDDRVALGLSADRETEQGATLPGFAGDGIAADGLADASAGDSAAQGAVSGKAP